MSGNHDPHNGWPGFAMPDNVTVSRDRVDRAEVVRGARSSQPYTGAASRAVRDREPITRVRRTAGTPSPSACCTPTWAATPTTSSTPLPRSMTCGRRHGLLGARTHPQAGGAGREPLDRLLRQPAGPRPQRDRSTRVPRGRGSPGGGSRSSTWRPRAGWARVAVDARTPGTSTRYAPCWPARRRPAGGARTARRRTCRPPAAAGLTRPRAARTAHQFFDDMRAERLSGEPWCGSTGWTTGRPIARPRGGARGPDFAAESFASPTNSATDPLPSRKSSRRSPRRLRRPSQATSRNAAPEALERARDATRHVLGGDVR